MVLTESITFSKSKYSLLRWHENIPRSQDQKDNQDKMLRNQVSTCLGKQAQSSLENYATCISYIVI